jgi:hypothetical protein
MLRYILILLCLPYIAPLKAGDHEERVADLTSDFLELQFAGAIEIAETESECHYTIPALAVGFRKIDRRNTKSIDLKQFRIVVVGIRNGTRYQLLERRDPLIASLDGPGSEVHAPVIKFSIAKSTLRDAEYIGLGVVGLFVKEDDGRYDLLGLGPMEKARILSGHALWPITVPSNIVGRLGEGDHSTRIYRAPRNSSDVCSSAKIR